jgi:hypothetical protein
MSLHPLHMSALLLAVACAPCCYPCPLCPIPLFPTAYLHVRSRFLLSFLMLPFFPLPKYTSPSYISISSRLLCRLHVFPSVAPVCFASRCFTPCCCLCSLFPISLFPTAYLHDFYAESRFLLLPLPFLADSSLSNRISP